VGRVAALALILACSDALDPGPGSEVSSISVAPSVATVAVGASFTLRAEVRSADGTMLAEGIRWATEDPAIAQVTAGGLVTGVSVGTVRIAASVQGKDALADVTVTPTPVASIRLSSSNRGMLVGESVQLTAEPLDNAGKLLQGRPVSWTTSNASVATVTDDGIVTALATGGAVIRATAEDRSAVASITVSAVPVARIEVNPSSVDIVVGQTTQLTAEPRDSAGEVLSGRVMAWSTSSAQVATVTSAGLVTAVSVGTATITAASDGRVARVTVNVSPRPVGAVVVSPGQVSINVGRTTQLTASPTDGQGNPLTGRPVSFTSSNTGVATVSSGGLVTGIAPGSATIAATSEGKSGTASVTVTPEPVVSVSVVPATSSIIVGSTVQLSAVAFGANGQPLPGRVVSWSSGAPGLASVSGSGLVIGIASGTAVILAHVDGVVGSATVSVAQMPVASVSVSPSTASLTVGGTSTLSATLRDASGNTLSGRIVGWSTSDQAVATVSQSGVVTGVAAGSTTITATSEGQTGTASITVTSGGPGPLAAITLTPTSLSLVVGGTQQVIATALDASGTVLSGVSISWSSANSSVATVNQSGLVAGAGAGNTTVTASSGSVSASVPVTVTAPAPGPLHTITVSPSSPTVNVGSTTTLTATARDASGSVLPGTAITWQTGNAAVATVSSSGVVTGVAPGTVAITASSGGVTGSATVTVQLAPIARITLSPTNPQLRTGDFLQMTATLYDAQDNVLTGRTVTWSSSDNSKFTVDANGLVHALKKGTETVTASSGGRSASTNIRVR
jgi:uncharacterized protein YjdB